MFKTKLNVVSFFVCWSSVSFGAPNFIDAAAKIAARAGISRGMIKSATQIENRIILQMEGSAVTLVKGADGTFHFGSAKTPYQEKYFSDQVGTQIVDRRVYNGPVEGGLTPRVTPDRPQSTVERFREKVVNSGHKQSWHQAEVGIDPDTGKKTALLYLDMHYVSPNAMLPTHNHRVALRPPVELEKAEPISVMPSVGSDSFRSEIVSADVIFKDGEGNFFKQSYVLNNTSFASKKGTPIKLDRTSFEVRPAVETTRSAGNGVL